MIPGTGGNGVSVENVGMIAVAAPCRRGNQERSKDLW